MLEMPIWVDWLIAIILVANIADLYAEKKKNAETMTKKCVSAKNLQMLMGQRIQSTPVVFKTGFKHKPWCEPKVLEGVDCV